MRVIALGLLCLLGLVFSACAGTEEPTPAPEPSPTPAPVDTPTPAPPSASLINKGMQTAEINGCLGCHTTDGRENIGPTWRGLYGKTEILEDIGPVVVDEAYLRRAIMDPFAEIVSGFQSLMPEPDLAPDEVDAIIAYITTLK